MNELNPYGLCASSEFWFLKKNKPEVLAPICNGVGSRLSWTYHFIPDTIWGVDITPASDIHDFDYTWPKLFPAELDGLTYSTGNAYKNHAYRTFLNNMVRIFEWHENLPGLKGWIHRRLAGVRRRRAQTYFEILQKWGGPSFWDGKNAPENLGFMPETAPAQT